MKRLRKWVKGMRRRRELGGGRGSGDRSYDSLFDEHILVAPLLIFFAHIMPVSIRRQLKLIAKIRRFQLLPESMFALHEKTKDRRTGCQRVGETVTDAFTSDFHLVGAKRIQLPRISPGEEAACLFSRFSSFPLPLQDYSLKSSTPR